MTTNVLFDCPDLVDGLHPNTRTVMENAFLTRRRQLCLTQADAAARCLVALPTWCNWEKFRNLPTLNNYPDIAAALEWKVEDVQNAVRACETIILKKKRRVA